MSVQLVFWVNLEDLCSHNIQIDRHTLQIFCHIQEELFHNLMA